MTGGDLWWGDVVGSRLEAFADRVEAEYAATCTVARRMISDDRIRSVWIAPTNAQASQTGWLDFGSYLQVSAGSGQAGGSWELDRTVENVGFVERVVTAVVQGRVTEVFGPSRSRVSVTFDDGTVWTETGYNAPWGFPPSPEWARHGRVLNYSPYRP
jgi:hypothetical protein